MRKLSLLLSVLAISAVTAFPASAKTKTVKTKFVTSAITVATSNGRVTNISGNIKSKKKCLSGRDVGAQHSPDGGVTILDFATSTTDAAGHFSINGDGPASDTYRLSVKKKKVRSIKCGSAETFGGPFS